MTTTVSAISMVQGRILAILFMPSLVKSLAQSTGTARFSDSRKAAPLAASMVASVAMKGGRRSPAIMPAFSAPAASPAATPAGSATANPCGDSCAATTLASAATVPTDRSMPPVMITRHMPMLL